MSWDVDEKEFYETFAELQDAEGSQRALEWAWSAFDWTQQELRKEATKSQSIVAEERAAVVDGLRAWAGQWEPEGAGFAALSHASKMIERGEHRREEGYDRSAKMFEEECTCGEDDDKDKILPHKTWCIKVK